jgi:hypothetical protein
MKEIIFSKKFKTISELCNLKGKVYVKFASSESGDDFMKCAEREGFDFKDGVKPTARVCAKTIRVNPDKTLNYVGIYGNMAYDAAKRLAGKS